MLKDETNKAEDELIHLSPLNKDLLSRVLDRGMKGAYYAPAPLPEEHDFRSYLKKQQDTITPATVEAIAYYYNLSSKDVLEIIADEKECEDWLERRALPWDDPW
jgi:hypothetical protein